MKKETSIFFTTLIADDGKTLKRVSDGVILGERITLGKYDSEFNYIEVDKRVEEGEL